MRLVAVAPNPSIDRLYELDRFRLDEVNRPQVETRVAGGKGLNVARAALALGAEVVAVALVAGHAGRWLAETLAAEGIPGRFAWTAGETRTCVAIHDAEADTLTELNEAGPPVSAEAWAAFVGAVREELAAGDVGLLTISGTLAPDAPTGGLAELAATATTLGVPVALDAGGPALDQALETRPWLVKLNAVRGGGDARDRGRAFRSGRGACGRPTDRRTHGRRGHRHARHRGCRRGRARWDDLPGQRSIRPRPVPGGQRRCVPCRSVRRDPARRRVPRCSPPRGRRSGGECPDPWCRTAGARRRPAAHSHDADRLARP